MATDRELSFCVLLQERQTQLLDPRDLLARERLVAQLRQRLAPPAREGFFEEPRPSRRVGRPRLTGQPPNTREIEIRALQAHAVPGGSRLDRVGAETLPQL